MERPRRERPQSSRFGSEYLVCAIRLTPPRISQRERRRRTDTETQEIVDNAVIEVTVDEGLLEESVEDPEVSDINHDTVDEEGTWEHD